MGQPGSSGIRAPRRWRVAIAAVALVLAAAVGVASCGGSDDAGQSTNDAPVRWTLVLDYQPNAVHAGLARALEAGYFAEAGIDLEVVAPSSTSDALTQVSRGRAQLGLADLIDVARRNERAADGQADAAGPVTLIGAVVQEPLSGILVAANSAIRTPADLAGKRIAVTGLPSDVAVVEAIVRDARGPRPTKQITLGFDGLKALHAGRVDGATAYWPADEVTLRQLGTPARTFSLMRDGDVHYPGLVAFTTPELAREQPEAVRGFAEALRRGTQDVIADRAVGEAAIATRYPELDAATTAAQLRNYLPLFGDATTAGRIDDAALTRFAAFAAGADLTTRTLTPDEVRGAGAPR